MTKLVSITRRHDGAFVAMCDAVGVHPSKLQTPAVARGDHIVTLYAVPTGAGWITCAVDTRALHVQQWLPPDSSIQAHAATAVECACDPVAMIGGIQQSFQVGHA